MTVCAAQITALGSAPLLASSTEGIFNAPTSAVAVGGFNQRIARRARCGTQPGTEQTIDD